MLSGDFSIHGKAMQAGDYCRAEADSVHQEAYSECGCVVFVVASADNRRLE